MSKKILINVSGGVIQEIFTNDPDVEILIYDWDNIEQGDDPSDNECTILSDNQITKVQEDWDDLVNECHSKLK